MENLLLIFSALLLTTLLHGQSVDGTDLIDLRHKYLSVDLIPRGISNFTLNIDFGQEVKLIKAKNQEVLDESGFAMRFNSPIGALNFLYAYGYEVFETYQNEGECSYLLVRRQGFDVEE